MLMMCIVVVDWVSPPLHRSLKLGLDGILGRPPMGDGVGLGLQMVN